MKVTARLAGLAAALLLLSPSANPDARTDGAESMQESNGVQAFHLDDIAEARREHGGPWERIVQVPDLFAGLYEIPAGGEDPQEPHQFDEVYHVMAGRATLIVEGEAYPVRAGSVVYVAKELDHRFVDIEEDLSVLVFFATPRDEE